MRAGKKQSYWKLYWIIRSVSASPLLTELDLPFEDILAIRHHASWHGSVASLVYWQLPLFSCLMVLGTWGWL